MGWDRVLGWSLHICKFFLIIMYGPMVLTQDTSQQHVAGINLLCTHGMCHKAHAADKVAAIY